jgi:hypothetical protein
MEFFKKFAVDPEELPDTVFASIGRMVWRDVGPTAICFRLLMKVRRAGVLVGLCSVCAFVSSCLTVSDHVVWVMC